MRAAVGLVATSPAAAPSLVDPGGLMADGVMGRGGMCGGIVRAVGGLFLSQVSQSQQS